MDDTYGSPDWCNDKSVVLNIELLLRPLNKIIVGRMQSHYAIVFSYFNGTNYYLMAEFGKNGIRLLLTNENKEPKNKSYVNIMGDPKENVKVFGINQAFDSEAFSNLKICKVYGAIEELNGTYHGKYRIINHSCIYFVKDFIILINNKKKPDIWIDWFDLFDWFDWFDWFDFKIGNFDISQFNTYYTGYWDIKQKKFVEDKSYQRIRDLAYDIFSFLFIFIFRLFIFIFRLGSVLSFFVISVYLYILYAPDIILRNN